MFAHDGISNYAAAATLSVSTPLAVTTPPVAALVIVSETNKLTVGTPVSFDATGSAAVEGDLVSATLDYGDGSPLDTFVPTDFPVHTYASTGPKTVTLTVTDSNGAAGTTTATVTVFPAPTASVEVTIETVTSRPPSYVRAECIHAERHHIDVLRTRLHRPGHVDAKRHHRAATDRGRRVHESRHLRGAVQRHE